MIVKSSCNLGKVGPHVAQIGRFEGSEWLMAWVTLRSHLVHQDSVGCVCWPVMAMPLPDKEVEWPEQQEWFTQVLERMFQEQEHVIQHLGTLRKNALELFGEVLRPCSKIVRGNGGRIQ